VPRRTPPTIIKFTEICWTHFFDIVI